MSDSNLLFWESVEKTPLKHIKDGKIGQHSIKSVNPQYQRKAATEKFGMFGIGWGIIPESVKYNTYTAGETTTVLSYEAVMFYKVNGDTGHVPIAASVPLSYKTSKGYFKVDHTADKKAATDALTKGLSFLGFNSDVFMGLHDDWQYIQSLQAEEQEKTEEKAIDEKHEYKKWRGTVQAEMLMCKDLDELEKVYVKAIRKASGQGDNGLINKLEEVKNKRIEELKTKAKKGEQK